MNVPVKKQYWIVEHLWRLLRAAFVLAGTAVWLAQDGWQTTDLTVLVLFLGAVLVEQLHGVICNLIERVLHFTNQHTPWE